MQDYKLVVRGLVGGASVFTPEGILALQNFSEFMSQLNEMYLSQGYKVLSVDTLRVLPADPATGASTIYEFAYHLVKDVEVAKEAKSK